MIKALIIDDESKAINLLRMTIERDFPGKFVLETAHGPEAGLLKLQTFKPELLFLDIEMPLMSGFDLLAAAPELNFKVIFTTAYDQYAIRAIRYNALDYLLKPISSKELAGAIDRFQEQRHGNKEIYGKQLENFVSRKDKNLAITTYDGVVFLEIDKIIRCEADLNYTKFFLIDKHFISSKTLKEYEDLLEIRSNFMRVHRSHLVNLNYILKLKNDGTLILKDNSIVPVSRRRKEDVTKRLNARH
jgi:two-component system LytT family response regulator